LKDDEKENDLIADYCELNLKDTWVGREMLRFYNSSNEQISVEMSIANQKEWIRYCEERSAPLRKYFAAHKQESMFHLYKFSGGAIGVASSVNLSEETWSLLRRAASVFSLAYSRFKDLKKAASDLLQLKLEKQRAEEALSELKATQSQLIHAEKMASLGELTAGIAHEIQNPLNFVNNFSDLSRELLDEMMTELKAANSDEAIEIAKDVKRNVEKILHHGKRADAIVKGMLQHSRGSSGIKEPTDINELADEFLRVAFHGLRAKDASFNATFSTDLDSTIGNVNIMPQDFGRVLLNLITNAFYAVSEKKNLVGDALQPDGKPYQPSVAIITRKNGKKVEISVKDNGNGIPREIREKIFQPFFTTKPTGQGTGLGLSLSYDFIQAHGGKLDVKTQEGEGAEFIIELPTDG
jgi:signal transduction histidine kinase